MKSKTLHQNQIGLVGRSVLAFILIILIYSHSVAQNPFWDNHLHTGSFSAMVQEGNDFWLTSSGGGLVKFDPVTNTKVYFNKHNSAIPSVFLSAIAIDSNGMKWIGTDDTVTGLIRFDGNNTWTCFNTQNSGLPANAITCLLVHGNDLWVGTKAGLALYDGLNWTTFTSATINSITYPIENVTDITVDSIGNIWFCCNQVGLFQYSTTGWKIFTNANSDIHSGFNDNVWSVTFDPSGKLWVGLASGVSCYDGNSWTHYSQVPGGPNGGNFSGEQIKPDNAGNILASSALYGVYRFNGTSWVYIGKPIPPSYYVYNPSIITPPLRLV
jgi:ligand-binding sensor domain-containing protein